MIQGFKRNRRVFSLVLIHAFIVSLSISCGQEGSIGHGTYYMAVPNDRFGSQDIRVVEFFLDEPVIEGEMTGWISAEGCNAYVYLCYDDVCELVYIANPHFAEETFTLNSNDSYVFDDFLSDFVPCYKGGEFMQEPFSCQRWDCDDSKHEIEVRLESSCEAEMLVTMDAEYMDLRTPFLGCFTGWSGGLGCACEDCQDDWEDECYEGECY